MALFDQLKRKSTGRGRQVAALLEELEEKTRQDEARFPQDGPLWQPFLASLRSALERYRDMEPGEPVNAAVRFYVTEDRMRAYGCFLPPLDGGEELRADVFGKELGYSGICAGLEQDTALTYLARKEYLRVFPIARGTPPQDGADGRREDLFEPRPVYVIDERAGKVADFSDKRPVQLVREGDAVCRVYPATAGRDGVDVTGRTLPAKAGIPAEVPIGANLKLSDDGSRVEATENGAVYFKDGAFFVQTAVVRKGNLTKDDKLVWMAFIDGDVPEGIKVSSTSNVLVMGECRGAQITSNGSVRVLKGIRKGCRIEAKGQVLAPVIRNAVVKAGKSVFAEEITASEVTSGECVYVLGGEGVIQGGVVRAAESVECLRIGGEHFPKNQFQVGFSPELEEEIDRLEAEVAESQKTLEKLRKSVLKLRQGGKTLPLEERALLSQLTEQKKLYEEQTGSLEAQLHDAKARFRTARSGRVVCQEMKPVTVVQIGDRVGEFAFPESKCKIHIYGGQVVAR